MRMEIPFCRMPLTTSITIIGITATIITITAIEAKI